MLWSKKEDRKALPDLPPFKGPIGTDVKQGGIVGLDEEYEDDDLERHELPSFPDSMQDKGFSQAAIKDAVGYSGNQKTSPVFPAGDRFKTVEMEEWTPSIQERSSKPIIETAPERERILEEPPHENFSDNFSKAQKNSDIFVKLDKFYSARKALVDAQMKLEDIDALLRKIRETKLREEQELTGWEKELMGVKARLNDVTGNLFEKVD